jgi:hypothetical protein
MVRSIYAVCAKGTSGLCRRCVDGDALVPVSVG